MIARGDEPWQVSKHLRSVVNIYESDTSHPGKQKCTTNSIFSKDDVGSASDEASSADLGDETSALETLSSLESMATSAACLDNILTVFCTSCLKDFHRAFSCIFPAKTLTLSVLYLEDAILAGLVCVIVWMPNSRLLGTFPFLSSCLRLACESRWCLHLMMQEMGCRFRLTG